MKNLVFFYFILILALGACGSSEEQEKQVLKPVRFVKILNLGGGEIHTFSGISRSDQDVALSFRVSGVVNGIYVDVGDEIKAGTLVADLDATDYQVQLQQSLADLQSAQTQISSSRAELYTSQANYQRVETLYENNSLPLSDFEEAKSSFEASESGYQASLAQVTSSQKQLESAQNQVNYTRLVAPISGIVTEKMVEENEQVNTGTSIISISTDGKPEVEVGIPEVFIARINQGDKVKISFTTMPEVTFTGTVTEVGYSADASTTYPVTIQIDNPNPDIRPGMASDVTFNFNPSGSNKKSLIAPPEAVLEAADLQRFVFILDKKEGFYVVRKQLVEVGKLQRSGYPILKGVKEGELVATAGLRTIMDGMKVRLMTENEGI